MTTPVRPAVSPDWAADVTLEPQGTAPVGTNDAIVPPSGYADNGWPLGIKPIRQYDNGIKRIHGDWINFLSATAVPWFENMRDALLYYATINGDRDSAAVGTLQAFRIIESLQSGRYIGEAFDIDPPTALSQTARAVVTDGYAVYLAAGQYLVAIEAEPSHDEYWRVNLGAQVYSVALWKDASVIVGLASGVIKQVNTITGVVSNLTTIAGGGNVTSLASNGRWIVAHGGTKAIIYPWSNTQATVTLADSVAATISGQKMFVAYFDVGANEYGINVYDSSGALIDNVLLPATSSTPTPTSICADGQFIVLTHEPDDDLNTVSVFSGGTRRETKMVRLWGSTAAEFGATPSFSTIDDQAVYVANVSGQTLALSRMTGNRLWMGDTQADLAGIFTDGHKLYGCGMDGADARAYQYNTGYSVRTYQLTYAYGQNVIPQNLHYIPMR